MGQVAEFLLRQNFPWLSAEQSNCAKKSILDSSFHFVLTIFHELRGSTTQRQQTLQFNMAPTTGGAKTVVAHRHKKNSKSADATPKKPETKTLKRKRGQDELEKLKAAIQELVGDPNAFYTPSSGTSF